MTYRCRFCHQEFSWESGSYAYVRSNILRHLDKCSDARELTRDDRADEASTVADSVLESPDVALFHRMPYDRR
ncbi:MAG TPA: hypothetical protein VF057_09905 [Thermoanaerobaculia bacterium]